MNSNRHTRRPYSSSQFKSTPISKNIVDTDSDDFSNLLGELSSFSVPAPHTQRAAQDVTPLKEEDLQDYVLNKTKALIEAGLGAVQDLTPGIVGGSDSREIEALSKLMTSTAQALEALQKTALINKKADRDEKLEKIRIEGRKETAQLAGPQNVTNNNILVASREDIMKKLFGREKEEVLNITNK